MLGGGPHAGGDALGPEHLVQAQGEAGAGRLEALQVLSARGRPPDHARCLPGVGKRQVLKSVVLRELHPVAHDAQGTGRAQAAAHHHGPVQARGRQRRQELHQGAQGHLLGILHARGEEGPAGRLQDDGRGPDRLHPPLLRPLQPKPRVGHLPRARPYYQGVHARGDGNRAQVADRARAEILPDVQPTPPVQAQADGAHRTSLRPLQRSQRLAPLQTPRLSKRRLPTRTPMPRTASGSRARERVCVCTQARLIALVLGNVGCHLEMSSKETGWACGGAHACFICASLLAVREQRHMRPQRLGQLIAASFRVLREFLSCAIVLHHHTLAAGPKVGCVNCMVHKSCCRQALTRILQARHEPAQGAW
mmetsp:Transcript_2641/g.5577  ORF Transcript_2641/g.5577 Transcript_2641/m.5577 type:complete len:364 (+) Transcript_2641:2902-3993(+)